MPQGTPWSSAQFQRRQLRIVIAFMVNMRRFWHLLTGFPSKLVSNSFGMRWGFFEFAIGSILAVGAISWSPTTSEGYALEGKSWPKGTLLTLQNQLGNPPHALQDGSTTWNTAVAPVFGLWNSTVGGIRLNSVVISWAGFPPPII